VASDAAKLMESDITKTKAWKAGLFVILIIFTFFITGTSLLNSQSEKQDPSKVEQVAFEIYTKYSKQLDTIRGKN
jgi:NADH:ubiquinone oxidoreductase subunit 6 (subunit J)